MIVSPQNETMATNNNKIVYQQEGIVNKETKNINTVATIDSKSRYQNNCN